MNEWAVEPSATLQPSRLASGLWLVPSHSPTFVALKGH